MQNASQMVPLFESLIRLFKIDFMYEYIFLPADVGGVPCPAIRHDKPVIQIFASSALLATRSNEAQSLFPFV